MLNLNSRFCQNSTIAITFRLHSFSFCTVSALFQLMPKETFKPYSFRILNIVVLQCSVLTQLELRNSIGMNTTFLTLIKHTRSLFQLEYYHIIHGRYKILYEYDLIMLGRYTTLQNTKENFSYKAYLRFHSKRMT